MIDVPLYPKGYPCKCSGTCNYSKLYEKAGKPLQIDSCTLFFELQYPCFVFKPIGSVI